MYEYKVSIIIPAYNAGSYILRTLNSIRSSVRNSYEIILVDDCSSDDTKIRVLDYAKSFANVKLVSLEKNSGPGVARDTGFTHAVGQYTMFFDSDDIMKLGVLDNVIYHLDKNNLDVSISRYEILFGKEKNKLSMWEKDNQLFIDVKRNFGSIFNPKDFPSILTITNYPWNKVCRTSFLRKNNIKFGSLRLHEDILPHWMIIMNTDGIYLSDVPICSYHLDREGDNVSNNNSILRLQCIDAVEKVHNVIQSDVKYKHFEDVFWYFSADIASWAVNRISSVHHERLNSKANKLFTKMRFENLQNIYNQNLHLHKKVCEFLIN